MREEKKCEKKKTFVTFSEGLDPASFESSPLPNTTEIN